MYKFLVFVTFLVFTTLSIGQVVELDKLQNTYAEGNFFSAFKQSRTLVNNPEFDNSFLPRYYYTLSVMKLSSETTWAERNQPAIEKASQFYREINSSVDGKKFLLVRQNEILDVQTQLEANKIDLKLESIAKENLVATIDVPKLEIKDSLIGVNISELTCEEAEQANFVISPTKKTTTEEKFDAFDQAERQRMLAYAETFLGVRYVYGGMTPKGFDCSGFTGYVLDHVFGMKTNRSARGQYEEITKIDRWDVRPGDFAFFRNRGKGVAHVGMIYSVEGENMKMIHASATKGIIIVDVFPSTHWPKKLVGFGRYLEEDFMRQAYLLDSMDYLKAENTSTKETEEDNDKL